MSHLVNCVSHFSISRGKVEFAFEYLWLSQFCASKVQRTLLLHVAETFHSGHTLHVGQQKRNRFRTLRRIVELSNEKRKGEEEAPAPHGLQAY